VRYAFSIEAVLEIIALGYAVTAMIHVGLEICDAFGTTLCLSVRTARPVLAFLIPHTCGVAATAVIAVALKIDARFYLASSKTACVTLCATVAVTTVEATWATPVLSALVTSMVAVG
jgi:hypothetical protein